MKISFLVPDIACPVLGPVTELGRLLQLHHEVEIVGPDFGHGICPMYRNAFPYKVLVTPKLYRFPEFFKETQAILEALTGDLIIAVKAFAQTLWPAYKLKRSKHRKMGIYLDEWDAFLYHRLTRRAKIQRWMAHWMHPVDDVYCPWVEKLIKHADLIISSSSYLQRKFGGCVVSVGADTRFFQPQPEQESQGLKRALGLDGQKLIVFGGVVRPHKGIEVLLEALAKQDRKDVRLLIVGPETEHVKALYAHPLYQGLIRCVGPQPKSKMPEYLGVADIIALPLIDNELAQSQVPCKIFEAMAMGKPIIASTVSDMPQILHGCGWLTPPGDAGRVAESIHEILSNTEEAFRRSVAAREKCVREYDVSVMQRKLLGVVETCTVGDNKKGPI